MKGAFFAALLVPALAHAERLPVHIYTTADGLANDRVDRGMRDSRGFLWFATYDGVSRFDGQHFESFGTDDGLPNPETHDVCETRDGRIWVATEGGVAWLDLRERVTRPRFHLMRLGKNAAEDSTASLLVDGAGVLWIGTMGGLWRWDGAHAERVSLRAGREPLAIVTVEDRRDGSLWLGTTWGLVHRLRDGRVEHFRIEPEDEPDDRVFSLALDRTGRLWIGTAGPKLVAVTLPIPATTEPLWLAAAHGGRFLRRDTFGIVRRNILEDSHGTIWIGGMKLTKYDGHAFQELGAAQGIPENAPAPCLEDGAGNLWLGTNTHGLVRLSARGLVTYTQADGLDPIYAQAFVEDAGGTFYAVTNSYGHVINRLDGDHFTPVRPRLPRDVTGGGWGSGQVAFPDRDGRWWYPTGMGLARYPKVARLEDLATTMPEFFTQKDGLPGRDVLTLYQDRQGSVWIATMSSTGLCRWDPATRRIEPAPRNWPHGVAVSYAEDRSGALWIGYNDTHLLRKRGSDVRIFGEADGLPRGSVQSILIDHLDRAWLGVDAGGVLRIDDQASDHPTFVRAQGLASERVVALAEDAQGRIYVGTTRGIDRIDPNRAEVGHFNTSDGLPSDYIFAAKRDPHGAMWFATKDGVAKLIPDTAPRPVPQPVYFSSLRVAGVGLPLAAGGEQQVPPLELAHDQNQLDVAFTSPSFLVGEPVRFQYRLGNGAWSTPSPERELHFAQLAAGRYSLEVRAALPDGTRSAPARVSFVVLRPIWQRWWFVTSLALVLGALGYQLYRWRIGHLLAIERVRTRIATDLHDELGSSLSRISILSEVAARRAAAREEVSSQVGDIGRSARELVDVASDIVWSTDPRRDDLGSLLVRLRHFAADLLEARGIEWKLEAPAEPQRIRLGPDQRRHVYLVLKEAIHNAARHSKATRVTIRVGRNEGSLEATVRDDGCGFDLTKRRSSGGGRHGNGLVNMRGRAEQAGGEMSIRSQPGQGTEIMLRLPLRGVT
jgi:signal transduction histidine kinase/ligand-binding sensor domain-containing protein